MLPRRSFLVVVAALVPLRFPNWDSRAGRLIRAAIEDLAQQASTLLGRRIRPEKLPTCGEGPGWIQLMLALAEVLEVNVSWLAFGERSAPAPSWWGTD